MSFLIAVLLAAAPTLAQQQATGLDLESPSGNPLQVDTPMMLMANTVVPRPSGLSGLALFANAGVCASEITATGRVVSKKAQLTPNRQFIFTTYEFAVEATHRGGPLESTIYLLRMGGTVDGYSITQSDHPPFEVNERYLVYLTYKNGYYWTTPFDWRIDNDTVAPLGTHITRDQNKRLPLAQAVSRTACAR